MQQATWRSEDDTAAFARQLATQPLLANAFITLHGDLGAGKTTLVRHLLRALGVQGRIKSPTYAVVEPHEAPGLAISHFDFYRFQRPARGKTLVFAMYLPPRPEAGRMAGQRYRPDPARCWLRIESQEGGMRRVELQAPTGPACQLLRIGRRPPPLPRACTGAALLYRGRHPGAAAGPPAPRAQRQHPRGAPVASPEDYSRVTLQSDPPCGG